MSIGANWEKAKLGDICHVVTGNTPPKSHPKYYGGSIPWIKPDNLDKEMYVQESTEYLSDEGGSLARLLPAGSVLVSCIGNLGKIAIAGITLATNQQINALIPSDKIDSEFLFFACSAIRKKLSQIAAVTIVPIVNKSAFSEIEILVPPIEEQRQIAARLKAQLAEVEKARQAAGAQLSATGELTNAIISDSLKKGKTVKYLLGDVLQEVKQGIGDGWAEFPVLGATRNGLAPAKEPVGKHPHKYKPVFSGTVFYNPMRILIGSIAFVDIDDAPGITSPDYVALTGREGIVDSRWFYYWLRSSLGEQCILSLARGAVRERMLFNRLAEGEIELPSYQSQQKASIALAGLKAMQRAIEKQLHEISILPQKILAQAFDWQER
ncbi:restriction endonuclease subunit S [uncultured Desulfobulbus sp.]|uniref:restriction endonuclease subunit S n=1 Tax=uncultured Desulfobulbus sp. TaxID=239745 RepID=UPI0029C8BCEE|nr:restriction endonuclease subunit S [uncultured Desulfobulbus sp.]